MAEFQVKTGSGDGLVARFGDGVLFVPNADESASDLVSVFRYAASSEVFDLVAAYVVEIGFDAPAFALIVVEDDQVVMRVFGDLEMKTDFPSVPMISGRGSGTWVDHKAASSGGSFVVAGVVPDPRTDLVTGIVLGGGVQLVVGSDPNLPVPEGLYGSTETFPEAVVEETAVPSLEAEAPEQAPALFASPVEEAPSIMAEEAPELESEIVDEVAAPVADPSPFDTDAADADASALEAVSGFDTPVDFGSEMAKPASPFSDSITSPLVETMSDLEATDMESQDEMSPLTSAAPMAKNQPMPATTPAGEEIVPEELMAQIENSGLSAEARATMPPLPAWATGSAEQSTALTPGLSATVTAEPEMPQPPSAFSSEVPAPPAMSPSPLSSLDDVGLAEVNEPPVQEWPERRAEEVDAVVASMPPAPGSAPVRRTAFILRLDDGTPIPVDSTLHFGRRPSSGDGETAIKIKGDHISRSHLRVRMNEGALIIEDSGSRNGSAVIPVSTGKPQPIEGETFTAVAGDRVFLGSRSFVVEQVGE